MLSDIIPDEIKAGVLAWIAKNPILAGLIAIIGISIHSRITKLVHCIFDFLQDLLFLTDHLENPDETYVSFLYYLHQNPDRNTNSMTEENLRIQTQNTCWWDKRNKREDRKNSGITDGRKLVKIPGSGFHFVSVKDKNKNSMWLFVYVSNEGFCVDKSSITVVTFTWNREKWNTFLQDLLHDRNENKNNIKIYLPDHTRNTFCFRFHRSIKSDILCHPELPILPRGIKEDILADAINFLKSEEYYNSMGIQWTRGYAFLGVPGNGKSSISKWLACTLQMNLCIIKQKIYKSGSFASLMENCPENSIIVIEDVDTLFDIEKREEDVDNENEVKNVKKTIKKRVQRMEIISDGSTITLGEILNAIESPMRQRKTILTFSSNMEREIDTALLRPGRIDKIIRLPNATYDQVKDLFMFHFKKQTERNKDSACSFAKIATNISNLKQPSMAEIRGCLMYPTIKESFKALCILVNKHD